MKNQILTLAAALALTTSNFAQPVGTKTTWKDKAGASITAEIVDKGVKLTFRNTGRQSFYFIGDRGRFSTNRDFMVAKHDYGDGPALGEESRVIVKPKEEAIFFVTLEKEVLKPIQSFTIAYSGRPLSADRMAWFEKHSEDKLPFDEKAVEERVHARNIGRFDIVFR